MKKGFSGLFHDQFDTIILPHSPERKDSHFTYFTGLRDVTGCLVLKEKQSILFVSPLEYETAKKHSLIKNIRPLEKNFFEQIKPYCGKKIGLAMDKVSYASVKKFMDTFTTATFHDASPLLQELRMIKRKDEVGSIKKACVITDKIYSKIFRDVRSLKTEEETVHMIHDVMRSYHTQPSFPVIVASGKNAASPHHLSDKTKLKGMTVIDMGVRINHYCSDLTRTLSIGKPTHQEQEAYHLVKEVQQQCFSMVREGQQFSTIHRYAQQSIGKKLIHSVGHGLGIDVHEHPFVRKDKKDVLKEGMIITLEPGFYMNGKFGIRIEDDILVKKERGEMLSKMIRDLVIV